MICVAVKSLVPGTHARDTGPHMFWHLRLCPMGAWSREDSIRPSVFGTQWMVLSCLCYAAIPGRSNMLRFYPIVGGWSLAHGTVRFEYGISSVASRCNHCRPKGDPFLCRTVSS